MIVYYSIYGLFAATASPSPPCDICTLTPRTGRREMVVNLKTATALSLAVPPSISLRADEVID